MYIYYSLISGAAHTWLARRHPASRSLEAVAAEGNPSEATAVGGSPSEAVVGGNPFGAAAAAAEGNPFGVAAS